MRELLKNYIQQKEDYAITYEEYMNIALYHETYGYYMKDTEKIGKSGDFITSSNVSDVFGKLFAHVFYKIFEKHHLPPIICEIGGGNGRFAKSILDEWDKINTPVTYIIIETSPYHRQLQQKILPIGNHVKQYESLEEAQKAYPAFQGIILSNELFDAFPIRMIEKKDEQLFEVMISINDDDALTEVLFPLTDEHVLDYLHTQNIELVNEQRFEVPLAMVDFTRKLSKFLDKGVVFTIDYGYTNEEWSLPPHRKGSLRGYHQHTMIQNPLEKPGEMDLTTHISFDALIDYGRKEGLEFVAKLRQDEFLLSAGILTFLQEHHDPNPFSEESKRNRAIRSLIMAGSMSQSFHVVMQEKHTGAKIEDCVDSTGLQN